MTTGKIWADITATILTVGSFFQFPWAGVAGFLAVIWWGWRLWDKHKNKKD